MVAGAYSGKWSGYGSTDQSACCSVVFFYNFFLLFAKGGVISITIFPLFYCDVCHRWNVF